MELNTAVFAQFKSELISNFQHHCKSNCQVQDSMMPEQKVLCPCPKCNGSLVTKRTVRNHASRISKPSSNVIPFSEWATQAKTHPARKDTDGESSDSSGASENMSRPTKRPRHLVRSHSRTPAFLNCIIFHDLIAIVTNITYTVRYL
jgi:hypothetical protein